VRKSPQPDVRKDDFVLARLWQVTEDLRDLVSAADWVLRTDSANPGYQFECRRLRMLLEEAKVLLGTLDEEDKAREGQYAGR
jgi:hypothetical protein